MGTELQQVIAESDRCVTCGLCLPHCPTYRKTGSEADSPRGRIQLINAVAKEILPANARFKAHIDLCLSCRSCEASCPNGVRYGALVDQARTWVKQPVGRFLEWGAAAMIKPRLRKLGATGLRLLQKTGIQSVVARFSPSIKNLFELCPRIPQQQSWNALYLSRATQKQGEVVLFLGCVSDAVDTDTLRAAVFVLTKLGYDVHVPAAQTCCGGLARQQGAFNEASHLIHQNQQAFSAFENLPLLSVASGCGAGLHDYLGRKVTDISAFLNQSDWSNVMLMPLHQEIAVHDPCTLKNVQASAPAVHRVLEKIPQVKIVPLGGNNQCCGGAGAYMLTQPEMAATLLSDKLNAVEKFQATILATSNIGCALHIAAGLRRQGKQIEVLHPVMILARQLGFKGRINP